MNLQAQIVCLISLLITPPPRPPLPFLVSAFCVCSSSRVYAFLLLLFEWRYFFNSEIIIAIKASSITAMVDGAPEESKASTMPVLELASFDPTKKKKKKKKPILHNHVHDPILSVAKTAENLSISEEDDFCDYGAEEVTVARQCPWEGTDRDYTYSELLSRLFHTLHENNPEISEDRPRTILRPPQVLQEGTSRTVIANFMDYCKRMHRQPKHVTSFVLDELRASGSLDGQQRLVLKGRFSSTYIEEVLRRYISKLGFYS